MGSPANFVTIRDGKVTVAYSRNGALEILEISVFGPEFVTRFLDAWQRLGPTDEFDDDAEGGLLVDFDRRVLMMFSAHRGTHLRAAYLDAVTRTWPGWQVRWAYDGIADLMDHAGADSSHLRGKPAEPAALYWRERTEQLPPHLRDRIEQMPPRYVVTIGDTQAYGLGWNAVAPWRVGPGLIEQLDPADRITTAETMPEAGMHLDPSTRTAGVWSAVQPLHGLAGYWPRLWPGWTLLLWDDRSGEQLQRCAGSVTFPAAEPLGRARLAESVMMTWSFFVAEDFRRNCRRAYIFRKLVEAARENGWFRAREQTRITRQELSTALETITGSPWPAPRWPHFKEPRRSGISRLLRR
ncbi:hypothetical protein ACFPIJ_56075 [Dactylosporangium cerinum]|uniref:Uncharacterized protein n=1 Tax=Dactylosporangium cerinum TaxID=1434730 RepID=A0ABV9WHU9_9ACTN